jgi:CubicO group peptidase (beta-lactamase class C family)
MASGHYVSAGPETDENAPAMAAFFGSTTAAEKLAFACAQPRKAPPGQIWVYHTADSFLLGAAIADVLRGAGLGRDVYDDLVSPIWRAIGQSAYLDTTRRTYDAQAQPFTGWGLIYARDDVVRAARFLAGGGVVEGRPMLAPTLLAEALQKKDPGGGFEALGLPNLRYRHGVWARNIARLIGCAHPVWTPFLSGYGGISIVLFPNGVTFYAFGDAGHFDWGEAAAQAGRIRPMCA